MSTMATGCVLAGGKSKRMGTDKALLELGGKQLISLAADKFSGFPEILISAAAPDSYVFTGLKIIPDEHPGIGPLGGIISALKAAKYDLVCFRPVDAPFFPEELHPLIASACEGKDIAVPVFQDKFESLFSCFSKTALPALEKLASEGDYKVAKAFPLLNTEYLDLGSRELTKNFGDPEGYLINANDPGTFSDLHFL